MGFKRLPNNFGTVYKLSGNRRNPWIARRRTGELWDDDRHTYKPIYTTVGYYPTRKDALEALAKAPENLTRKEDPTFGEVYDLWKKDKYGDDGVPRSYWSPEKYLDPIRRKKISSFRAIDIETFINDPEMPRTIKHFVKVLMNQTFDYAIRHDIIEKNYCALARPNLDMSVKLKKAIFTGDEIKKVWNSEPSAKRDLTLVLLYTGMRINEVLKLELPDIHLDDGYLVGGSKTKAGKDRVVPIHPDIMPIMQRLTAQTRGKLFHFSSTNQEHWMRTTYDHSPHECRHTWATVALQCGMNEEARKRILGHASEGVTNKSYTHLEIEFLKSEMNKLKY